MNCPVCDQCKPASGWCQKCLIAYTTVAGVQEALGWIVFHPKDRDNAHIQAALAECRRMVSVSDWERWRRVASQDLYQVQQPHVAFEFSLFADWLADNDCPLQEAAVRELLKESR